MCQNNKHALQLRHSSLSQCAVFYTKSKNTVGKYVGFFLKQRYWKVFLAPLMAGRGNVMDMGLKTSLDCYEVGLLRFRSFFSPYVQGLLCEGIFACRIKGICVLAHFSPLSIFLSGQLLHPQQSISCRYETLETLRNFP